jgi:hypothetical protein
MATLITEDVDVSVVRELKEGFGKTLHIVLEHCRYMYTQGELPYGEWEELSLLLMNENALAEQLVKVFHIVMSHTHSSESILMTQVERECETIMPKHSIVESLPDIQERHRISAAPSVFLMRVGSNQVLVDYFPLGRGGMLKVVLRELFNLLQRYTLLPQGSKYNLDRRLTLSDGLNTISKALCRYFRQPTAPSSRSAGGKRWQNTGMYHGLNTIHYIKIDYTKGQGFGSGNASEEHY